MNEILNAHPGQQDVAERREFDHVRVSIAMSYSLVPEKESQRARMVDLSNGGLRFLDRAELFRGSQVALQFRLPKTNLDIVARGRIVMSFFDSSEQQYSHSVAFTKIAQPDLQAIVGYIYGAQHSELQELSKA